MSVFYCSLPLKYTSLHANDLLLKLYFPHSVLHLGPACRSDHKCYKPIQKVNNHPKYKCGWNTDWDKRKKKYSVNLNINVGESRIGVHGKQSFAERSIR